MINKYYYNQLPLEDKVNMLCQRGELVFSVSTTEYDVSLYVLDHEYVELFYSISFNRIEEIKTIEDPDRLDFYTLNIDLEYLLRQ